MATLISYRNWADLATLSSNFGTVAGFPLDNLKARQLAVAWKSTSAGTGVQITADLGKARPVRLIGLMGVLTAFNLSDPNEPRTFVQFSVQHSPNGSTWTSVGLNTTLDSMWPSLGGAGYLVLPAPLSVRYWRITTNWAPPAGEQTGAGRLWIADALEFKNLPWSLGLDDGGKVDESAGFQVYEYAGPRRRRLRINTVVKGTEQVFGFADAATVAQQVPSLQSMQHAVGNTGDVVILPRTDTVLWRHRLGIYGRLTKALDIRHVAGQVYRIDLDALEEL